MRSSLRCCGSPSATVSTYGGCQPPLGRSLGDDIGTARPRHVILQLPQSRSETARKRVRAKVFRGETSEVVLTGAQADLETDIEQGVWFPAGHDLADVFQSATALSRRYTPLIGVRTLDSCTLHSRWHCARRLL